MQKLVDTKNEYLIDVRTPGEYEKEHLNNAINIDYNSSNFEASIDKLEKTRPIFIYCLSGGRSGNAMDVFAKKDFTNVYNMQGGILQWKAKNYPLNTTKEAIASSWIGMTKEEYKKLTSSEVPVLVDFKAAWCGPCKMLKPILEEIQTEYERSIKIVYLDVDQNKSLADDMKIKSIPLMIYYKNGKVAMNIDGYADKASIINSLKLKK
jgi:thioredoxin